ncbi:hypothetical protein ACFU98_45860 [Streptomyces sp. NPDC057575]|uniref:hypothetical protein n=1 Tax=unclassified Streptomyces TaxID=2593676 RepID=UPI0036BFCECA
MRTGTDPVGEQGARLVAVDDAPPLARSMAVADVHLARRRTLPDAELDSSIRGGWPAFLTGALIGFPLLRGGDGGVVVAAKGRPFLYRGHLTLSLSPWAPRNMITPVDST